MLNPNSAMLARVLYEERVAEALQQHRHWSVRAPRSSLLTRLLLRLGNRLIDLGHQLKTQSATAQLPQDLVEA